MDGVRTMEYGNIPQSGIVAHGGAKTLQPRVLVVPHALCERLNDVNYLH